MHRIGWCGSVINMTGPCQAGYGSNSFGMIIGRTIRHEASIRMPYQVDAIRVDIEVGLHGLNDVENIGRIVYI